jgi:Tfp pilus assembly protein PilO
MRFRVKQQVLILIAAAVLITAYIVLRYLPRSRISASLNRERTSQNILINSGNIKQAEMPKLQVQLDGLEDELADFDSKVPYDTQLGQFLGRVAALMDEHRLTEQQIAPHDDIESGQLVCTPVTMKCKGRLDQIRRFCQSLQGLNRAVRIEKFHLANDSEYSGQLRMEAEAVIYHKMPTSKG